MAVEAQSDLLTLGVEGMGPELNPTLTVMAVKNNCKRESTTLSMLKNSFQI